MIERFGVMAGLALLRRRLRLCGETHRRRPVVRNPVLHYQHGDCDPGCCDVNCLPDTHCGSGRSAARGGGECARECGCFTLEQYLDHKYERAKERWRRWRERRWQER